MPTTPTPTTGALAAYDRYRHLTWFEHAYPTADYWPDYPHDDADAARYIAQYSDGQALASVADVRAERDRFHCILTIADEPACGAYARVTVIDASGERARGCARHAVAALDGIDGLRVDWTDTKGLNEFEVRALRLTEDRNGLRPLAR